MEARVWPSTKCLPARLNRFYLITSVCAVGQAQAPARQRSNRGISRFKLHVHISQAIIGITNSCF